jgi:excinuclease UvrABC ATPase subunit
MCHKGAAKGSQFETWEASKHAKAMEILKSEAATKIATQKGLKVAASEAAECAKCHSTGHGADASLFDAKFDKNMGVQCEACHGAGNDYKAMAVMKDRAKSIAAGMNPIAVADGTAEKHCVKCHNSESPTFKGFNFKESWEKIKHPKPAAK